MSIKEKYLIVSLGSIGRRHLKNLRELKPESEIAVWRQHHAVNVSERLEGADHVFSSLEDVLAFSPRAAIICGPANRHLEVATILADRGIHLLIEKPLADSLQDVSKLLNICNQQQLILMVGYNLRFLPSLAHLKRMVDNGAIGKAISVRAEVGQYLPDWRPASDYRQGVTANQSLGGGALLELSHEIDYIYWIFGLPARVTARGGHLSDLEIDVEDTVELILEYANPMRLINIHIDMVQRAPIRQCRIAGDLGTLVWNAMTDTIEHYGVDTKQWHTLQEFALADKNSMYIHELEEFLSAIDQERTPVISGEQGRDVLAIVDAAKRSLQYSITVELKNHV